MKKLVYPKTYATIKQIIWDDESRWMVCNGKLIRPQLAKPIFVVTTDSGEEIVCERINKRGHTPLRIYKKWWQMIKENPMRNYNDRRLIYIGERIKLFKKNPSSKEWYFSYSGC